MLVQYEVSRGQPATLVKQLVYRTLEDYVITTVRLVVMVAILALKFWARDSWKYPLEIVPVVRMLVWVTRGLISFVRLIL